MAASGAERAKRYRAHKRGDHSLCVPGRCEARGASPVVEVSVTPVTEAAPGGIEVATRAFVDGLQLPEADPRSVLGECAVALARRVDESGAVPAAVRELRVLLSQLAELPDQEAGPVDGQRAQRAARRVNQLLQAVG